VNRGKKPNRDPFLRNPGTSHWFWRAGARNLSHRSSTLTPKPRANVDTFMMAFVCAVDQLIDISQMTRGETGPQKPQRRRTNMRAARLLVAICATATIATAANAQSVDWQKVDAAL